MDAVLELLKNLDSENGGLPTLDEAQALFQRFLGGDLTNLVGQGHQETCEKFLGLIERFGSVPGTPEITAALVATKQTAKALKGCLDKLVVGDDKAQVKTNVQEILGREAPVVQAPDPQVRAWAPPESVGLADMCPTTWPKNYWDALEDTGGQVKNGEREELWVEFEDETVPVAEFAHMNLVAEDGVTFRLLPGLMPQFVWLCYEHGTSMSVKMLRRYGVYEGLPPQPVLLEATSVQLMLRTIDWGDRAPVSCHKYEKTGLHTFMTPVNRYELKFYTDKNIFLNKNIPLATKPRADGAI